MDPADSVWYQRPAVSAFLKESVRQEAKHAQEIQSPFYGSRLALGGPRSLQTAMATAEPAPMPRAIRLSTCSFSPVTTPPPSPLDYQSDKRVKRRRKKDYVTPDVRLTPLQSFALFLGLPRSELHKLSDSSSQPGPLEDLQPSLPPPTSWRRRRSHRHHSFSAEQLPVTMQQSWRKWISRGLQLKILINSYESNRWLFQLLYWLKVVELLAHLTHTLRLSLNILSQTLEMPTTHTQVFSLHQ
ncbi:uncharacterized protein LOC113010713 [Astatotilapia calliptera]|uniref:uncharacterized protein LOC113010713 n=1 Tax=Astatotilapia calliptera TaxID=8154 RepID=UPI000E423B29|nr:uncharacterized protein LOC113010713 [Astatotilapia calliptera]